MRESDLVDNVKKWLTTHFPRAIVNKVADRFTRGLPDLELIGLRYPMLDEGNGNRHLLYAGIEIKMPGESITKLQSLYGSRLAGIGDRIHQPGGVCDFLLADNLATVMRAAARWRLEAGPLAKPASCYGYWAMGDPFVISPPGAERRYAVCAVGQGGEWFAIVDRKRKSVVDKMIFRLETDDVGRFEIFPKIAERAECYG